MTDQGAERRTAAVTGGLGGIGARYDPRTRRRRPVANLAAEDLPFATGTATQIDGGMHIQYH